MEAIAPILFILLMLCIAFYCFRRAVLAFRRARSEAARIDGKCLTTPKSDYDQITGEVYGSSKAQSYKSRLMDEWEANLIPLWNGNIDIEFTYESGSGKIRRNVTLQDVLRNERGSIYLRGFCHVRNEVRTFSRDKILTKLMVKGKRLDPEDFIVDYLGISTAELGWD